MIFYIPPGRGGIDLPTNKQLIVGAVLFVLIYAALLSIMLWLETK